MMDPNSGNQLVRILTNQPGHLVARQFMPDRSVQGSAITLILMAIAAVGLAIYFARIRYWRGQIVPVILFAMIGSWVSPHPRDSWQMELNQPAGVIDYSTLSNNRTVTSKQVALSNISSAEMQFDRGDTRVALILKDGTQILPLGQYTVQNAPNDYVILTAIRQAIGQVPPN